MGSVAGNNELVPFSQQGSLDWVALGRVQYSASVAILARLSGAGVEPITMAFGQAMCCAIPIGHHGEKFLHDALAELKAFSSFGDIIWFGVGVRHVVRDIVQTSEGSSLVALCAALSEGHSIKHSALIMFELAKLVGAPSELRPCFTQWEALVEVSASVFNKSMFGSRIQQLRRLNGLQREHQETAAHPVDLARVILEIGRSSRPQSERSSSKVELSVAGLLSGRI